MLVKTLLEDNQRELITIQPETSIDESMALMIENKIGCLPVLDINKTLVGILSDKDIFKSIHETGGDFHSLTARDLMTTKVISGILADEVDEVAKVMQKYYIRHIPIIDEGKLVGLISQRDILNYEIESRQTENRYLQQHLDGVHTRDRSADL